jgi:Cu(I)/Ag(I) efflux system membrane fusion protein
MKRTSHILITILAACGGAAVVLILLLTGFIGNHGVFAPTGSSNVQTSLKTAKIMYICPMHSQIIRDKPGTCPICAMMLVPMKDHDSNESIPKDAIQIEATMIQNIGVRTAVVSTSKLTKIVRVNGSIAIDPQRVAVVNARTMGWIESIPQGTEGVHVAIGQKLASFYSPDLVAAQEDFLQSLHVHDDKLVSSARKRLEVLGIPATIIDSIQMNKSTMRSLPIQSPISGIVLSKYIVQGQNIMPGFDMYRIADLSHVWAVGKAYPEDVINLRVGMDVQVILQGLENTPREGRLVFVSPIVDPETKTTEIRVDIKNTQELSYKPGMNADLRIPIAIGTGIAIPTQSVIRTGERTVAIVALGKGYFAPRNITLGIQIGDSVQVLEGLNSGDSLVTSAQFLIDSESNLKKAVQAFGNKGGTHAGQNN